MVYCPGYKPLISTLPFSPVVPVKTVFPSLSVTFSSAPANLSLLSNAFTTVKTTGGFLMGVDASSSLSLRLMSVLTSPSGVATVAAFPCSTKEADAATEPTLKANSTSICSPAAIGCDGVSFPSDSFAAVASVAVSPAGMSSSTVGTAGWLPLLVMRSW